MSNTKRTAIIIAMCIGTFMCLVNETIMNVVLPEIESGLHTNLASMTWAINAYTIIFAALTIPFGRLAQRFGVNKSFLAGTLVFLVGAIVAAAAPNVSIVILGRGIQALGVAFVFSLSMVIGISTMPKERRSFVIAMLSMTQGLAGALGPSIGGSLAEQFNWRWIFIINIPLAAITIALCLFALNFKEPVTHSKVDVFGSVLSAAILFTLTLALVQSNKWGWHSASILGLFAFSVVGLMGFILYERRIDNPMIPMKLFTYRQFNGAALSMLLGTVFFVGVLSVLPTYFVSLQNKSDLTAALLITPASAMIVLFSPLASMLVNKLGGRIAITAAAIIMGTAYVLLWHINMNNELQVGIACAVLGAGYGIITGSMQSLAAADFSGDLLSSSQPVILVMRLVGFALAASIFITALSNNADTAKRHSISYAENQIARLNLSASQTKRMQNEVANRIQHQKNGTTKPFHVSKAQRNQLVNQEMTKLAVQALDKVPTAAQAQVKPKIIAQLNQAKPTIKKQVDRKADQMERKINQTTTVIRHHTKAQFAKSFIDIYKVATPFAFALVLLVLIFRSNRRKA